MIKIVLSFRGLELAFPLKSVSGLEWSWGAPPYHGHRLQHKATTARKIHCLLKLPLLNIQTNGQQEIIYFKHKCLM